ncbi:flagellar protein FliT [Luminiphilus sp.]|nr:flagellar protein FliT [Luminiphilus sp.]
MGSALSVNQLDMLLARGHQSALLANILVRTQRMLEAARSDDWPVVTILEKKRSQLVKQCFSEPVGAENSELFSEALAIMLHMNEELVALLEAAKEDASVRRTDHQFAHEAIGHYLDTKSESL